MMRFLLPFFAASVVAGACANAHVPTSASVSPPRITSLSPSSGRPGIEITITGSQFAPSGNHVKFGEGYIRDLASPDGATLRFVVPDGLDRCPPNAAGPCPAGYPPVRPGDYEIVVLSADGASNAVKFTVTSP